MVEGIEKKKLILNAFVMNTPGHLNSGLWKHPDNRGVDFDSLDYWIDLVKKLEKGKFHAMFIADTLGIYDVYGGPENDAPALIGGSQVPVNDPAYLISALALVTKSLGFGVTASTTYEQPYELARRYSTLDHLTKGRVAWNVVTSYLESAAKNFGLTTQIPHNTRYEIAEEYVTATYKLWEGSWRDDAVVQSKTPDIYADPSRVTKINHKGQYFEVPGPHICAPSPQRTPFLFQAGMSGAGKDFAAKHAEAIFVNGPSPLVVKKTVDDIRQLAAKHGRDPQSVKIIVGLLIITGPTDEEAQAKLDSYFDYGNVEGALALFGGWFGFDVAKYSDEQDLREVDDPGLSRFVQIWASRSPEDELLLWNKQKLGKEISVGGFSPRVVGSGTTVVDEIERWADLSGVDGFNLAFAISPGTFEDIIEYVLPELRKRGRFWDDYAVPGGSLRENILGVKGHARLRDDHPGKQFYWDVKDPVPKFLANE